MASPFRDTDAQSPGFERLQGCLALFKVGDTWRLYRRRGPAPHGALWRFEGRMAQLRPLAGMICENNTCRASTDAEGEYCVIFDSYPTLPDQVPAGIRHRRRVRDPSVSPENPVRSVEGHIVLADTKESSKTAPKRAQRKDRKRKGVSPEAVKEADTGAEGPVVTESNTDTETSADGNASKRSSNS